MARYFSRYQRRRRNIRWLIYIVSAIIIVIAVVAVLYRNRNSSKARQETVAPARDVTTAPKRVATEVLKVEPKLLQVRPQSTAEDNPEVAQVIDKAVGLINEKPAKIIEARDILNETLPVPMSAQQLVFIKSQLSALANEWLFSRRIFPQDKLCGSHMVKSGDRLEVIGKKCRVPYEILMEINNIDSPRALQAARPIKVINGPFHVRVYRSKFSMDIFLQNTYVCSFDVGLGKPGRETPTGLWVVGPKLEKPTWTDPDTGKTYESEDTDYPLGSRWISLTGVKGEALGRTGIAFHGTNDSNMIGIAGSRGCVRLHNGDVILIYKLLMPGVSQVEVVQ
ncbi:MAG: L,D-transpeptidase family protein [Sedimentisphaerales bacterium]|nr:L,D-transpeptidase family protein [Sedimentisphaerales bacterium]